MAEADPAFSPADATDTRRSPARRRGLLLVGGVVLAIAIAALAWHLIFGGRSVSTDNAYVGADTAIVTPLVGGQVAELLVGDTENVRRGQVLLRLDDSDAKIALTEAKADLAKALRAFTRTLATGDSLNAQVSARDAAVARARAQLAAAQADYAKAQVDYSRRQRLAGRGAVSGDELTSATAALATSRAALDLARAAVSEASSTRGAAAGDLAANQALTRGATATTEPEVMAARARVDRARLDLDRTVVRAPVDGVVTRRVVQVGQRLAPGATAMMIVPISQLYVDANFKEGQLSRVRPGQAATLTSDLYGGGVVFHGKVVGFAGGTGSSFALIPAQNATGNWIKVVQRLPVRIRLDPAELARHPLRVGLSMDAEVELGDAR